LLFSALLYFFLCAEAARRSAHAVRESKAGLLVHVADMSLIDPNDTIKKQKYHFHRHQTQQPNQPQSNTQQRESQP